MKLLETLTEQQRTDIVLGTSHGVFSNILQSTDVFYKDITDLAREYYFGRSGSKTVSPFYLRVAELNQQPDTILGQVIRSKFIDKWTRIYSALVTETYEPLDEFKEIETKKFGATKTRTGTNKDVIDGTEVVTDTTKTSTKETTTRSGETANDRYGFNSVSPVGNDTSNEQATETVSGGLEDNVSQTDNTKNIDNTVTHNISTKDENGGQDTTERSGRNTSGAKLVEEELTLRNKQIFFDIVYRDVDSIMVLQIYN